MQKCLSIWEVYYCFLAEFGLGCRCCATATLLSTRVTNRRIKTNLKVTVASVTVASGVPPTLSGERSIWQVLRMRGVLIDENHLAASKLTDRV